jgi:hypothetical protein
VSLDTCPDSRVQSAQSFEGVLVLVTFYPALIRMLGSVVKLIVDGSFCELPMLIIVLCQGMSPIVCKPIIISRWGVLICAVLRI